MKIHSDFKKVALLSSMTILASCGGNSSGGGGGVTGPSSIDSLPSATGPVVSSNSLIGASRPGRILQYATASNGVVLSEADQTTFNSASHSTAFCEMSNMIKNIYREASQPDKILCYIAAMNSTGVISDDIYNGNWNYIKLINLPADKMSGNANPRVKTRIVKSNGAISDFKMFTCFNGTTIAPEQSEYISQSFTSTSATIVSKSFGSESGEDYGAEVSAIGKINSNGEWTEKTLEATNYWSNGSFSNNQGGTIVQGPASLNIEGFQKGSWGQGSATGTYSNAFIGFLEVLNPASLETMALGNGSARVAINNTYDSDGSGGNPTDTWTVNQYESWDGDSKNALGSASSGDYYSEVNGRSTPSVPSSVSAISFNNDESWNCEADSFTEADFNDGGSAIQQAMAACDEKFGAGDDWIDCSATYQ